MTAIEPRTDRIATLGTEISGLYKEVDRLDRECKSVNRDKDSTRYYVFDIRRQTLREQARTLNKELSQLLELELRG